MAIVLIALFEGDEDDDDGGTGIPTIGNIQPSDRRPYQTHLSSVVPHSNSNRLHKDLLSICCSESQHRREDEQVQILRLRPSVNQFGLFLHLVALSRFEIQQPRNTGRHTIEVIRSSMIERWWGFLSYWFVEYKAWQPHHYTRCVSIKNMIRDDLNSGSCLEQRQH
ncbi:hypothetical protein Cgig2_001400 [Carnegiea gigantea]|uniref:Uncharacterized protein n=1 Tax=Carnegiea gigantea TaxID=171969 RepID=A0A9Q1QPV4_9CARY|nr:hypothetical protein Cgig2_001400 [Carnegiea gigantea]